MTVTNVLSVGLLNNHLSPATQVLVYGSFPHGAGRDFSITVGGQTGIVNVAANTVFLFAVIPTTAPLGHQTLTVNYLGSSSNAFPITLAAYAPEFAGTSITIAGSATPPEFGPYHPFRHAADGTSVTPASPAAPGELVIASLTGLGQTNPPTTGFPPTTFTPLAATPALRVSGQMATIVRAGSGGPGAEVDFNVPGNAAAGIDPVILTIGGIVSNTAIIAVGAPSAAPPTPVVASAGPVNGASFAPGGIVPGEIATIFGTNLTSNTGINLTSSLPLLTDFLNVSVLIDGVPAPLFAVDNVNGQEQINFEVPWEAASQSTATLQVANWNGSISAVTMVPVLTAQPGIINYSSNGIDFGVILHADYQLADTAHPVTGGETVLIYCTGLGAVSPQPTDGTAAKSGETTPAPPVVTIGGAPAVVTFSGLAPDFVGLYQLNVEVPSGLASRNQPVVISMNGASSNSVMLPVQ